MDAVKAILARSEWKGIPLQEIMTRDVLHIPNHVTLAEAAEAMLEADIHHLVITGPPQGGSVPIGIVTPQDVLKNAALLINSLIRLEEKDIVMLKKMIAMHYF